MSIASTLFVRRVVLLAVLLLGLVAPAGAQAPAWQAVIATSPTILYSTATVTATTTDASGNVYVGGYFDGGIKLGGITLTSAGDGDMFVAKWLPATQSFAWVQRLGGPGDERLTALAVSGSSLYATGYFYNTSVLGSTTLTSAGSSDIFVAKLTDAGSSAAVAWAQRAGGTNTEQALGLAVSGTAVYVAGTFAGAATFGTALLTSAGYTDGFLSKLTDAGPSAAFSWTQQVAGTVNDYVSAVVAQGSTVYVTGLFTGTVPFGTTSLASGNAPGTFIAKLTDLGASASYVWAQKAGATSFIASRALAVQGSQVYVGGYFYGPATFGSLSLPNASASTQGCDAFVAKLTDAGTSAGFVWARGAGGLADDVVNTLAVRGSNVYFGGYFVGTSTFGATTLSTPRATSDAYVACLADAGSSASFAWALGAGGDASDAVTALAFTSTTVYIGGMLTGAATFGSQTVGLNNYGFTGFLTSVLDATGLATTGAAAASTRVALFPTPTPAGTLATVQLPAASGASAIAFTVLDNLGRVVRARTASLAPSSTQATLDVAGLAPGMYALRVAVGESLGTARLVVE